MSLPTIRAAIFDLDGTLLDSMPVWDEAWASFCRRYSPGEDQELFAQYKTRTMPTAIDYYRRRLSIRATPEELTDQVNGFVLEGYRTVRPKAGAGELLRELRRRGIPACVATNTARPLVEYVLDRLDLARYVDFIITCAEFGSGKDRPEIFLECARRLGVPPESAAVFEDAPHALATAKKAGFITAAVRDDSYAWAEPQLRETADMYLTDLTRLTLK